MIFLKYQFVKSFKSQIKGITIDAGYVTLKCFDNDTDYWKTDLKEFSEIGFKLIRFKCWESLVWQRDMYVLGKRIRSGFGSTAQNYLIRHVVSFHAVFYLWVEQNDIGTELWRLLICFLYFFVFTASFTNYDLSYQPT